MLYARQINPAHQESPLFIPGFFPEDIAVCGNRDFHEHLPPVFERVRSVLEAGELADVLDDFIRYGGSDYYKNRTAAIMDYLYPEHKPRYSTREVHAILQLIPDYGFRSADDDRILCSVLSLVTGQTWERRTIRGCCQSDWNCVYYPSENWSREALRAFEAEYFNTGTEWIVHDGPDAPEGPEDIEGFSLYVTDWDEDDIRRAVAEAAGFPATEPVTLYRYAGSRSIDIYEAA